MEFAIKSDAANEHKTPCVIVGVYEDGKLTPSARAMDHASKGEIAKLIKSGDFNGKSGQTLTLYNLPNVTAERTVLTGLGAENELSPMGFRKAVVAAIAAARKTGANQAYDCLSEVKIKGRDLEWKIRTSAQCAIESDYQSDTLKSKKSDPVKLKKITFNVPAKGELKSLKAAIKSGTAIGNGANLAKELGNLPGNVCTPNYLAEQAKSIANAGKNMKTKILEEHDMEKLGMGALLSVSRGSRQPAKFIIMDYKGGDKSQKPIVLVGKGLTFDSGGISIKPSPQMDEMKYDMCGGASVLGTMNAIAEMELPINVIGVVPSSENMPDGDANKPGDIVTSLSGQTIEILNTDAEGRLILCDALTYCERFEPDTVIDIATLTGACVIALGKYPSGLFTENDKLANDILKAGEESLDRAWRMPLWEDYQDQLKSNFADMGNVGGREGGAITAACFLARYTKKFTWAHLDVAGTAWNSGSDKGATGRPVALLTQYIMNRVES